MNHFIKSSVIFLSLMVTALISNGRPASASANPKVLLVTSLDGFRTAESLPWVLSFRRSYYRNYNHSLEKVFRDFFKDRGFEVEVMHYADQYDLAMILHSPDYDGIYIAAHEADNRPPSAGMDMGGLFDSNGFEVTPVLEDIHPNVKVLALVGCQSFDLTQKLYQKFKSRGTHLDLQLLGFKVKTDAKEGLKSTMNASLEHLQAQVAAPAECPLLRGYPVHFERSCPVASPAVRIQTGEHLVASFPACQTGETQTQSGFIGVPTEGSLTANSLKLQITAGANPYLPAGVSELGTFTITRPGLRDGEAWKPFVKPDGSPFGTSSHVYRHTGRLPESWELQEYHRFYGCRK